MCVVYVKPMNVKICSDDTIRTMFQRNPDGAGLMYVRNNQVYVKKGYQEVETLLDDLHKEDFTETNLILHFRIGTSGKKDGLNCHPYPIYQENEVEFTTDLAMVHNGILYNYNPPFGAPYNDTQNFIKRVLSKLETDFIYQENCRILIEELIGRNRLCFLTKDNEFFLLGPDWIEETDGSYFSNTTYKPIKPIVKKFKPTYVPKSKFSSQNLFEYEDEELFKDPFWYPGIEDEFECEEDMEDFYLYE